MKKDVVLIFGAGHLTYRLRKILLDKQYKVVFNTFDVINSHQQPGSLIENLKIYMETADVSSVAMVYLLDDKDEHNLQMIIAIISLYPDLPITASLFNENLIPHLQNKHGKLIVMSPATIAAPSFVDALYKPLERDDVSPGIKKKVIKVKDDRIIQKLLFAFTGLLLLAVAFFHYYENFSWIDSAYFVVVTAATVGYGDFNLAQSDTMSKLFGILLILLSTISLWMIFSLTVDSILKKRIQLALGRKKYNYEGHVVVCGLGRLGYAIVEELLERKEKVIIIEQSETSRHMDYFRHLGAEVYIGDGRLAKVLDDVNITKARAMMSVINNDALNLEIGLNARSFKPGLRLILRIFDEQMAEKIKEYFDIRLSLSASAIADDKFYGTLKSKE